MTFINRLRLFSVFCAGIGFIDALYLTWVKVSHTEAACLPGVGNCEVVNTSQYSAISGMPIAVLGAAGYLIILFFLYFETRKPGWKENGILAVFGLSFIGVLYSVYLTYLELAVIHAICPFCVLSATAMLLIFFATTTRLVLNQASSHH